MAEKKHLAKVAVLLPLGALFGPGAPDPIWVILRLRFSVEDIMEDMEIVNMLLYIHPAFILRNVLLRNPDPGF